MDQRHASRRNLDTEVAARHHDHIGRADDPGQMVERNRGLDLRNELGPVPALRQPRPNRIDVLRAAYERQADEVGLDRDRHPQRDGVGVGERLDVGFGPRDVHALTRTEDSAAHDLAHHVAVDDLFDAQHDRAVGQEDVVTRTDPAPQLGEGRRHARGVAHDRR